MKTLLERISASADELRLSRATNSVEMAAEASRSRISRYKSQLLSKLNELENRLDFGSTSTTDLLSSLKDFNSVEWSKKLHDDLIPDIFNEYQRLEARIRLHNALFPNHAVPDIDSLTSIELCKIIMGKEEKSPTPLVKKGK